MSRERPAEPPKAVPDQQAMARAKAKLDEKGDADIARLKRESGAGAFGRFAGALHESMPNVRFTRRGYEADIVPNLQAFYDQRPRPWRQASCDSTKKRPWRERLKAHRLAKLRRAHAAR